VFNEWRSEFTNKTKSYTPLKLSCNCNRQNNGPAWQMQFPFQAS